MTLRRLLAGMSTWFVTSAAAAAGVPLLPHTAGAVYVARGNHACTDRGPGTAARPFCTISASVSQVRPGSTVHVAPGVYRERVVVDRSGTPAAPITWLAAAGVTVTGGADGFAMTAVHDVRVTGFHVTHTSSYGLRVVSSVRVTLSGNEVAYSGSRVAGRTAAGIYVASSVYCTVSGNSVHDNSDAGIYLPAGSTRDLVSHNVVYSNARGYTRAAPGIDVRGPSNRVIANISHDNEDSGMQLYTGASASVVADNVVYRNGDHGIDVLGSSELAIVANTVYRNTTSGIDVEGGSTLTEIRDNVSQDNALANTFGQKGQIRVDATSVPGSSMDSDLVDMSGPDGTAVQWDGVSYATLADFTDEVPSQELRGIQADPLFVAASAGNLALRAGSPAIDSADATAAGFPATDVQGHRRVDDPRTVNTGLGSPGYADRGAYEYQ